MSMQSTRYLCRFGFPLLALGLSTTASPVVAEPYPSNMIRIVIGAPAGTPGDIISRIVANELGQSEGWRIIVENKPGAMGTIGAAEVLKQPADGYTINSRHSPRRGCPRAPVQHEISARYRFRAGHQAHNRVPRSRCQSLGAGQVAVGAYRPAQEPAGQAHVFVRRVRHAGASCGRAVQTANRCACGTCPLSSASASDRRSAQRN